MQRLVFRGIPLTIGVASMALLGTSQATAADSKPVPAAAPSSESSADLGVQEAAGPCGFITDGDAVHVSSSAFEASGHGFWRNINCKATKAVVTVQLQQFYSDGKWRNKGTVGKKTVKSGGGAGKRATGRAACNSKTLTGWRSVIDVDLVGQPDSPEKGVTKAVNINCRR